MDKSDLVPDESIVYSIHVGRQVPHDFVRPQDATRYPQRRACPSARWVWGSSYPLAVIPSQDVEDVPKRHWNYLDEIAG